MPDRTYPDTPVQLRIGFSAPTKPITIHLDLAGLSILAGAPNGSDDEVFHYLTAAGVVATHDEIRGVTFPTAMLPLLVHLPEQVNVVTDDTLTALYLLAVHPSHENLPATLSLTPDGTLQLSWFDGNTNWYEAFAPETAPALLNSELPFVATSEAWEVLKQSARLPVLAGRARVNLDGYVEVFTTKPQLAEGAPLPGLFRLDETHFGLPLAYASAIDQSPGFVWEGHRPTVERGPAQLPGLPIELTAHAQADLRSLVDQLAAYRAQAVIWESGLGRRVFALAALHCLDAWPALIIAPPQSVWVWQRHLDLLGRTHSLTHPRVDVQIITYLDLVNRQSLPSPPAIVFDDLSSPDAAGPAARAALHRLDGVLDAYRIACGSNWPAPLEEQVAWMSVLRPGEFRPDVPLAQRYPVHTAQRAGEHVAAYLSRRTAADPGSDPGWRFRRSSVTVVEPSEPQLQAFATALARSGLVPAQLLVELLEVVSSGPAHSISPKIAVAARKTREAAAKGSRVAVVTRSRRSAMLLRSTLRPLPVRSVDASEGAVDDTGNVVIVRYDTTLPNLRGFDEVVVVDYPWSSETIEAAVGSAADERGPHRVTCVHMAGTIDDRLAMLAARRREMASVTAATAPPGPHDIEYLLSPRWV
jgi:hypothetical protein